MSFDLLIKGGHVLDPGQGLDGRLDIAISAGRIAAIEPDMSASQALRTLEIRSASRRVVPGLIDLHTHIAYGAARALGHSEELGAIAVGREADLNIFDVVSGQWRFSDTVGQVFTGEHAIVPIHIIRGGELIAPNWGPHPWGWLPEQA